MFINKNGNGMEVEEGYRLIRFCVFSSTPDIESLGFIVKVLTGDLEYLLTTVNKWGYDGVEFLPDPLNLPDPEYVKKLLRETGSSIPVLNTGRMAVQELALLQDDHFKREQAMKALRGILDLASHIDARVGLGMARGVPSKSLSEAELDLLTEDTFTEIARYAESVGTVVMLEPIDPGAAGIVHTMREAVHWVKRINSPNFTVMLDTYQLLEVEESFRSGIEDGEGRANHIHLYDPSRWPPGVLPQSQRLDWSLISKELISSGFSGTGSVVLAPEGDPNVTAPKAIRYLRSCFATRRPSI